MNTVTSAVASVERRIVASLRRMRCDVRTFDAEGCGRRSLLPQPGNSGCGDWFHQFGFTLIDLGAQGSQGRYSSSTDAPESKAQLPSKAFWHVPGTCKKL